MKKPRSPINTAAKVTQAREYLGLDKAGLSRAMRLSATGRDTVRRWETPGTDVPGPVQLALEYLIEKASKEARRRTP